MADRTVSFVVLSRYIMKELRLAWLEIELEFISQLE
jgi:hypothetical protein